MAKNLEISDCRKKARHIFEVRYTPLHKVFDSKGVFIETIEDLFKSKLSHWRMQAELVQFGNDFEALSKQINLDHLRTSIIYEDPDTYQEFVDDSRKYFKSFFDIFPTSFPKLKRLGYRRISIIALDKASSYEDCLCLVNSTFSSAKQKFSFKLTDCKFTFSHELGQVTIGPVRIGESWLKEAFSLPEFRTPKYGIGIDVDSAAINPQLCDLSSFYSAFNATLFLTDKIEEEVFKALTVA